MAKIDKDWTIAEVIEFNPELENVLRGFGMHCFSCAMATMETLEEASYVHDIDLDFMLEKLNSFGVHDEISEFIENIKNVSDSIYNEEDFEKALRSGKKLTIKLGADPSRPDLHLGHSVVLRQLKKFQDLGHEVVFIVGDFTGMIGDPTGKSKTRPSLTIEQTRASGDTYYKQVTKILSPDKTKIVYNSDWLEKMNFKDVIMLAGKYTLARLLERDDFNNRYKNGSSISVHELLYPLIQGYDSVHLNADLEIGGTDQTFNMLVGRELQKDYGQTPQVVITFPLLVGLDGVNKMSKSLDNYIGLDEPSEIMYEKCMKIPDNVLEQYFRLTTDIPESEYKKALSDDIREAHRMYAREIIKMYQGEDKIKEAETRYNEVASGAIPDNVPCVKSSEPTLTAVKMLIEAGFAKSTSQARQLIDGKGVKINNELVTDYYQEYDISSEPVLIKGKNHFVKFVL